MSVAQNIVSEHLRRSAPGAEDIVSVEGFSDVDAMSHAFWLNDLLFIVPPENIVQQSEDVLWKSSALRANHTAKIYSGLGSQVYRIQLNCPYKGAILNVDWRNDGLEGNTGKRGGLLDLIIQFKNIPFARIENAFLRSTLKIPKDKSMVFCLHTLSVNTVPGEPNNIEAVIIATVFNYSPYSPDWAYKDDWVAKPQYGGLRFSDVNPIEIEGALKPRDSYEYFIEGSDLDRQIIDPWVIDSDPSGTDGTNVQFNIAMTDSEDYLWNSESHFLMPPKPVKHPSFSSVFKDYIDWLHARWHKRSDGAGNFNAAKISPYGSENQNLGDSVKFVWREYKRFPMDRETREAVQRQIRDYVLNITEPRTFRPTSNTVLPSSAGSTDAMGPETAVGDDALARVLATRMMEIQPSLEPEEALAIGYGVIRASRRIGTARVTPAWLCAVIQHESTFDPAAVSSSNARGLMQLREAAAIDSWPQESDFIENPVISRRNRRPRIVNPDRMFDINNNIEAGAKYLEWTYQRSASYGDQPNRWLAYYNRGANSELARNIDWNNINREDGSLYQTIIERNFLRWTQVIKNAEIAEVFNADNYQRYEAENIPTGIRPEFLSNRPARPETEDIVQLQESAINDIDAYARFIEKIEASDEGWFHYREDLTVNDVFYREHSLIINTNSSSSEGIDSNRAPITIPFISGTATNLYAQLPLNGQMLPTAQSMGKRDDTFLLQVEAIGLNNIKMIRHMTDMLRSQAKEFPYIPDSWAVRVENNFINAFGNRYFVFNATNHATIRESPGLYAVEIHLESNPIDRGEARITSVNASNLEDIRRAFVQDLMNNRLLTIKPGVDGDYYVAPVDGVENRISNEAGDGLLGYLQYVAASLNLVNSLFVKARPRFDPESWNPNFLISNPETGSHPEESRIDALGFTDGPQGTTFIFRNRNPDGRSYLEDASNGIFNRHNFRDAWPNVGVLTFQDLTGLNFEDTSYGREGRRARGISLLTNLFYRYQDNKNSSRFTSLDPIGTRYDWNQNFAGNLEPRVRSDNSEVAEANVLGSVRRELRESFEQAGTTEIAPLIRPYIRFHPEVAAFGRSLNAYFATLLGEPNFHSLYIQDIDTEEQGLGFRRLTEFDFSYTNEDGNSRIISDLYWSSRLQPLFYGGSVYDGEFWSNPFEEDIKLENAYFGFDLLENNSENLTKPNRSWGPIESKRGGYNLDSPVTFFNRINPEGESSSFRNRFLNSARNLLSENFRDFEIYLWEQVARPYIINALIYSEIHKYSNYVDIEASNSADIVYLFPQTREAIRNQRTNAVGPCFRDLELPLHPYWNANPNNDWKEIYTDPDFYMFNWGFEGNLEVVAPEAGVYGTSDNAYNVLTQIETEYAIESMYGLQPEKLLEENQRLGRENPFVFNGGPGDLASLYDGTNMAIDMEHGFSSMWRPTTEGKDAHGWSLGSEDTEATNGALRNSGINSEDVNDQNSPDSLSSDEEEESFGTTSNTWINHGMNGLAERQAGQHVNWTNVIAQFGPNVDFPDSPSDYDSSFQNFGTDFWGFNEISSRDMLVQLQGTEFSPYQFNVDTIGPDPDRFVRGNWGYDDVGQWSNSRTALYGKVRDALKSLGRKKYVGRRAFPTFKVYFIEEDNVDHNGRYIPWKQIDDLYVYNQVESIKISDSRKRAASTCVITFLNLGGALDGRNMWSAAQRPLDSDSPNQRDEVNERRRAESASPFDTDTSAEQNINEFILQEGTKIKVKLGNSNHPDRLDCLFVGAVTETKYTEEGNKITVVAQSYGAELVAEYKGTTVKEVKKTYYNTFDLLAHMMFEPELKHFGRHTFDAVTVAGENQSLAQNQIIYKNTIGRRPIRAALWSVANLASFGTLNAGTFLLGSAREWIKNTTTQLRLSPTEGPQDDNIFVPNFTKDEIRHPLSLSFTRWSKVSSPIDNQTFNIDERADGSKLPEPGREYNGDPQHIVYTRDHDEWEGNGVEPNYRWIQKLKKSEIEYNVFFSTVWDLFEEMTLRHPGFVKHPRVYDKSNRLTMFFGLPDQRYWSREARIGEAQLSNELYRQMTQRSSEMLSETLADSAFDRTVRRATRRNDRRRRRSVAIRNEGLGRDLSSEEEEIMNLVTVEADQLNEWLELLQRRFKPFRDWHHVNSATDIISNNMVANSYGFYTAIDLQYVGGKALKGLRNAVDSLEDDNINILSPNAFVRFKDKHIQHVQSQRDLSPENKRAIAMQFPNCRGKIMAKRYARSLLAQFAKEMYKGSLLILGNSKIKPYDVLILNDTYNDIHGPIEVEEVIQILSPTTGHVTEIIPDTFIIQEDIAPYVIYNGILPTIQMKADLYLSNMLFRNDDSLSDNHAYNIVAQAHRESFQENADTGFAGLVNRTVFQIADNPLGIVGLGLDAVTRDNPIDSGSDAAIATVVAAELGALVSLGAGVAIGGIGTVGITTSLLSRYFLLNYIANHKAFIMIPLIRGSQPWVSGYDLTTNNLMHRGPFDLMRRWWDDGAAGATLAAAEAAALDLKAREFFGDELNWYSRASQNLDRFARTGRTRLAGGTSI